MNPIDGKPCTRCGTLLFIAASVLLTALTMISDQLTGDTVAAEAATRSFPTAIVTRGDVPLTLTCDDGQPVPALS